MTSHGSRMFVEQFEETNCLNVEALRHIETAVLISSLSLTLWSRSKHVTIKARVFDLSFSSDLAKWFYTPLNHDVIKMIERIRYSSNCHNKVIFIKKNFTQSKLRLSLWILII